MSKKKTPSPKTITPKSTKPQATYPKPPSKASTRIDGGM